MKRNKLRRKKHILDKEVHREHVLPAVIVLSDGCSSDVEASQERLPAFFSNEKKSVPSKEFKLAPIFLPTHQRRENKWSSEGGSGRTEQKTVRQSNNVKYHHSGSNLTGKQKAVLPSRCWRAKLQSKHLDLHLEEIQKSNPGFPVATVFHSLLKKANEGLQGSTSTEPCSCPESLQEMLKERKRRGAEASEKQPKRLRCDPSVEAEGEHGPLSGQDVEKQPTRHEGQKLSLENSCHTNSGWGSNSSPVTQSIKESDELHGNCRFEDILWTDKYLPQHSSEVICNSASVNKLHSWLKKWKLRAEGDERRQMEERKRDKNSKESWDCGDFQGEARLEDRGGEPLPKALLLTGPSGVGKTAAVYACAQELGFKIGHQESPPLYKPQVFEVNCSSQRSGRHVLAQLKEATQSHLVDIPGDDPLKPAYFNHYSINSSAPKPEALPGKIVPKNITSTSKRRAARSSSSSGRKFKAKPSTVTLAHYFKVKGEADHVDVCDVSTTRKPKAEEVAKLGSDQTGPTIKKTATSLILFEEVDVIFEDDVGFLAAIKAFMATTKRPVVLTTGDRSFRERFDCCLDEIIFKAPSALNICSYLQLVCLAENVRLPSDEAGSLFRLSCGDVRRCLLQLQLWINGSRGWTAEDGGFPEEPTGSNDPDWSSPGGGGGGLVLKFPPGCSAYMLGLHPLTLKVLLKFLKLESWSETDISKFLRILSESWRRDVPLLYSNLELLLPMAAPVSNPQLQTEPRPPKADRLFQLYHPIGSCESPTCFRSSRLSRQRRTASASYLTNRPQRTSSLSETLSKAMSSCDKPEKCAAKAVTDALDGLADFFDLMSNIDAMLSPSTSELKTAFVWTGAALKDGVMDEPGEEDRRKEDGLQEIQAAAEGLGGRRCWRRVTEARTEAHSCKGKLNAEQWNGLQERLLLTSRPKGSNLSFTAQPPCETSVSQRRFRLGRMVLSSKSYCLLGNRRAVCVDYLPVLRFICRSVSTQQHKAELWSGWSYLSGKHLGLSKSAIQLLAEDFTLKNVQENARAQVVSPYLFRLSNRP